MSIKTNIFTLTSKPGVKRDGTELDSDYYQDAQWCRFQRGRPRKVGGFRAMTAAVTGPIRNIHVDARSPNNAAHVFSPYGVQQVTFDVNGLGGGVVDRTPAGLVANVNYNWQSDSMFQSGGGGLPVLVCAATPDLDNIASDTTGGIYSGDIRGTGALTQIQDGSGNILVSGGCCVLQPFLFVYGSNGLIRNSNANDFTVATGWASNNANTANVSSTKIVKGLPIRGGSSSPAGLFWSLESLIRVTYIGGTTLWKYDPVSADSTVMSKNGIVEYDGLYYWAGIDRFYVYNGIINELPNDLSANFFFDNVNYAQAAKVWALKVPRFGEIWWFYPTGSNTECDSVVIYNVKQGIWYDLKCARTAGYSAQVFRYPLMAGGELTATTLLTYTAVTGTFTIGDVITGGTSGATGKVVRTLPGTLNLTSVTGTFASGEGISNAGATSTGTLTAGPAVQQLDVLWQHEYGVDRIRGTDVTAIESYFETNQFQFSTGGPVESTPAGATNNTRLVRFEPDFVQVGNLELTVLGRKYAASPLLSSGPHTFTPTTEFLSLRDQRRQMSVRVRSNVVGGFYEMGAVQMTVEPGDERS